MKTQKEIEIRRDRLQQRIDRANSIDPKDFQTIGRLMDMLDTINWVLKKSK